MKKLKIRGKEVRRLGYADDAAVIMAVNLSARHYTREDKTVALARLEELLHDPEAYRKDDAFGELAEFLLRDKPVKPKPARKPKLAEKAVGFEIFGREHIDEESLHQMYTAMKLPLSVKGALMPDAHLGYGLPIGGVVAAWNAVMPYGVGMDIGCRMCLSVFGESPKILKGKRDKLKNILLENSRFGLGEFSDIHEHELMERREFREIRFLKSLQPQFFKQLGTSGHGNHFVDMGYVQVRKFTPELGLEPGDYFAILSHSGSRNFGAEIAKHYTKVAQQKLGLSGEGAKLSWLTLDSEEGQEYWQAMTLAGDYSAANHRIIHQKMAKALGEKPVKIIENHHNFAWLEKLSDNESLVIHRKGATPAAKGDTGIIPGNMVSPAFIVAGKGNEKSLNSASHGAGRLVSRRQAKKKFTQSSMKKVLKAEGVELLGGATDESPMAYKDIHQVMEAQKDLVDVLALFYPKIVRME
ncbi:MAG: RtcB family protein [Bacteroidales bacterium]